MDPSCGALLQGSDVEPHLTVTSSVAFDGTQELVLRPARLGAP